MMDKKKYTNTIDTIKRLLGLYIDNAKYTVSEKVSLLLAGVALFSITMVCILLAVVFFAVAMANLLDEVVPPYCSYLIVCVFFIALVVVAIVFKKTLIINPIARFISSILLNDPEADIDQK